MLHLLCSLVEGGLVGWSVQRVAGRSSDRLSLVAAAEGLRGGHGLGIAGAQLLVGVVQARRQTGRRAHTCPVLLGSGHVGLKLKFG